MRPIRLAGIALAAVVVLGSTPGVAQAEDCCDDIPGPTIVDNTIVGGGTDSGKRQQDWLDQQNRKAGRQTTRKATPAPNKRRATTQATRQGPPTATRSASPRSSKTPTPIPVELVAIFEALERVASGLEPRP